MINEFQIDPKFYERKFLFWSIPMEAGHNAYAQYRFGRVMNSRIPSLKDLDSPSPSLASGKASSDM